MTSNAVLKGVKSQFINLMQTAKANPYASFIQTLPSRSDKEVYYISETVPGVKELIDEVNFDQIKDKAYEIVNKNFYDGVKEDRNRIEDSQEYLTNSIEMKIREIVNEWQDFDRFKFEEMLKNGGSTSVGLAFDGTAFFSTARPNIKVGSTGIANTLTGTAVTLAGIYDDFGTAKTLLKSFKDGNERPFNRDPNLTVIVPPALEDIFKQVLGSGITTINTTGQSKSNPYAGAANIVVNYGSTDNTWYLVNSNKPVIIAQTRKEPEWFMNDDNRKNDVEYYFKARKGFGYGMPASIVRVTT